MSKRIDELELQINELMKLLRKIKVVCTRCNGEGCEQNNSGEMDDCYECKGSQTLPLLECIPFPTMLINKNENVA